MESFIRHPVLKVQGYKSPSPRGGWVPSSLPQNLYIFLLDICWCPPCGDSDAFYGIEKSSFVDEICCFKVSMVFGKFSRKSWKYEKIVKKNPSNCIRALSNYYDFCHVSSILDGEQNLFQIFDFWSDFPYFGHYCTILVKIAQ